MLAASSALVASLVLPQGAAAPGVTLLAPLAQNDVFLIDQAGTVVHTWPGNFTPGLSVYLTPDYQLLRTNRIATGQLPSGFGGGVELLDWSGAVQWTYDYYVPGEKLQHHDVEWMSNGNVLLIAWTWKDTQAAIDQGRDPALLNPSATYPFLPDHIVELRPEGPNGATVVWEWHVWDHLVQDFDATKPNFGVVADHPELINLNYPPVVPFNDWNHLNTVSYNEELDQIMLTSRHFNEVWVIDHSTTTAEAAGHTGGVHGRGGDLLYRWGNPQAYDRGTAADQQLFGPHDAQWIQAGRPGAGNLLVFNNGLNRPAGAYSSVEELVLPVTPAGDYDLGMGAAYGPTSPSWSYTAAVPTQFYSPSISGCERLPGGSTLVCSGDQGWLFEVDSAGTIGWQYQNDVPSQANNRVFKVRRYGVETQPVSYCTAGQNSVSPTGARIGWSGAPSLIANSMQLEASDLPPGQVGIFFFGPLEESPPAPFGAGLRCVNASGLVRLYPPISTGAGSTSRPLDLNGPGLSSLVPGDVRHFQFWYRDPAFSSSQPFNLTDGLRVVFAP